MEKPSHPVSNSSKVTDGHRDRLAYVYVRQSSYYQVEHHRESQRRQYDFHKTALGLGWPKEKVVVVDEDQGQSGSCPGARSGFSRIVMGVGRGEVGMVMSLEASRLARNSPDWHTLIYVSRYSNTLIADEHGIYDPADAADRMVLGIRGQMSEMELDQSIHRMVEGRWSKARRGEYLVGSSAESVGEKITMLVREAPQSSPVKGKLASRFASRPLTGPELGRCRADMTG